MGLTIIFSALYTQSTYFMEEKKLFLIDAYAMIYRAYYALIRSPRITSAGFNTSAIFGFINSLEDILRHENPSHIAVCFDPPHGASFRREIFPEYKAQREAQPEDITASIPYIKEIVAAFNIPIVEREGFEADDVIGTLATIAEKEGYTTYMMTPDKDYGQLVTDHIFMYRPSLGGKGFEVRGPAEICEKYGIENPVQVIDLLALMGDASDNIPGCPGVGEKTAVKLIREFHSVENLIAEVDTLKGSLHKKVSENSDKIVLSKELATIRRDVPMDGITIGSFARQPENIDALRDIYTRLEFRTFLKRLGNSSDDTPAKAEPAAPEKNLQPSLFDFAEETPSAETATEPVEVAEADIVNDIPAIDLAVEDILACDDFGVSIYATGANAMDAAIFGIALAYNKESVGRTLFIHLDGGDTKPIAKAIAPLFNQKATTVVSHDVKRDIILLQRLGICFDANYFDTSIAHYLLQPEMRHSLALVAENLLGFSSFEESLNIKTERDEMKLTDAQRIAIATERASLSLALHCRLSDLLKQNGLSRLADEIEFPLVEVLASMEREGMRVDPAELQKMSEEMTLRLEEIEQKIYSLAGEEFNISSPKRVGEILFEKLQIDEKAKKTKKGDYSTTEEILESYAPYHPIVGEILKHRRLKKLLSTYINALPKLINPETGHIHTTLNQTVTATGRISSTNPNLQNIPIRTDDGKEIRRAFIPDEGCVILSADYSQIELRLLADLSNDPDMIEAFHSGEDFHAATAAKIYHLPVKEVDADMRRKAKTANFGIVYGISAFGLSQRLGIPRSEAKVLIDSYYNTYPGVKNYITTSISKAKEQGFVTTIMNRKRYLPNINSRNAVVRAIDERNAVNAPIQGSAADVIKRAMIDIYRQIRRRNLRSRMIMQVHDELIFNVYPEELTELQQIVVSMMEKAYPTSAVKLEVSAGVATNWLEAH